MGGISNLQGGKAMKSWEMHMIPYTEIFYTINANSERADRRISLRCRQSKWMRSLRLGINASEPHCFSVRAVSQSVIQPAQP